MPATWKNSLVPLFSLCAAAGACLPPAARADAPESPPPYSLMKVGEVMPAGWVLEQMRADLHEGITGAYDRISANVSQELFARQNRRPGTKVPGNRSHQEKAWWAGEHEGYWMDALVRSAILTRDEAAMERSRKWVEGILTTAAKTGYIGIYTPDTRFPAAGFDGELWTQSRAYQALLAWYEHTGDARVLEAVKRSVRLTMDHYRTSTYFGRKGVDGGVTHGVGYMQTLEWLHRLTGDPYFGKAAVWLYSDFSAQKGLMFQDLQLEPMLDANRPWRDHTPHVAEALGMPGIVHFLTGQPEYKKASDNVLTKLARHTNPGGGLIAGKLESVGGVSGGGDEAAEYCSMTEGIESLNRLFLYQPDFAFGEWSEKAALNAAQGARLHPVNTAVIYLARDNRLHAANPKLHGGRELFSASHVAAACCTLNAMRLMPYYVEGMWYRSNQRAELVANLYGPNRLTTQIGGLPVVIDEQTQFPFSDEVRFVVHAQQPVSFDLVMRIPANSGKVDVKAPATAQVERSDRTITIRGLGRDGDTVAVDFDFQVVRQLQQDQHQAFYQWGPLVFALPVTPTLQVLSDIRESGFHEYLVPPANPAGFDVLLDPEAAFKTVSLDGDPLRPFARSPIALDGRVRTVEGKPMQVRLLPLGATLLRRTTFPVSREYLRGGGTTHRQEMDSDKDPMRDY